MLIDTIVPSERNISAKSTGKFSKKTNLEIEINRIWKIKIKIKKKKVNNDSGPWSPRTNEEGTR